MLLLGKTEKRLITPIKVYNLLVVIPMEYWKNLLLKVIVYGLKFNPKPKPRLAGIYSYFHSLLHTYTRLKNSTRYYIFCISTNTSRFFYIEDCLVSPLTLFVKFFCTVSKIINLTFGEYAFVGIYTIGFWRFKGDIPSDLLASPKLELC